MSDILPKKHLFDLPEGVIYLDGNSLGPLPKGVAEAAGHVITQEWGGELIRAWNSADWISLPKRVGNRIASLMWCESRHSSHRGYPFYQSLSGIGSGVDYAPGSQGHFVR